MAGFEDLKVFQLSYRLSMEIFEITKSFPVEERYSLTDQIRRSSRSVPANIAEGYRKRQYTKMFVSKMADADGEVGETLVWLRFSNDCGYIDQTARDRLIDGYQEVGRMLGGMIRDPEKFAPRQWLGLLFPASAYCHCLLLLVTSRVGSTAPCPS